MVTQTPTTSFNCSQCGGTASAVPGCSYLQCDYCGSLVFSEENPASVDRLTPIEADLAGSCPTCSAALQAGEIDGRRIMFCGRCYGVLIRNADLGHVVRERRARRRHMEMESAKPIDPSAYQRQLHCPSCAGRMEVHPYYGPGNIVIDSCSRCFYVWLDHGELQSIERAEGSAPRTDVPVYVNGEGEVVIVPEAVSATEPQTPPREHPLQTLAEIWFGL